MGIEYKVLKDFGTVADHNGVELKLRLIKWGDNPAKYDLRAWQKDFAKGGLTLSKEELVKIKELIGSLNLKHTSKAFTTESMNKIVENVTGKKRGRPPKKTNTPNECAVSNEDSSKETISKVDTNIIQFPKQRPEIKKAITEGNATYEDCEEKLGKDIKMFVDPDSQYVLTGLLELCKVDENFRNNVMREGKDFTGALDYMADMCQKGYGYKHKNYGFVDQNLGLGLAIDYFNMAPEPKPEPKPVDVKSRKKGRKKKVV